MNWFGTASRANIISIEVTTFLDTTIEELIENFEFLGDWEERFAYLIELGKKLPPLDEIEMTDEHRVHGCQASVWLRMLPQTDGTFDIHADSDAFIVKGLIAVAVDLQRKKCRADFGHRQHGTFAQLGLDRHLSPTRRNGLHSMVSRVKALAGDSIAQAT